MALPASGPLSMSQINGEFGRGTSLNNYRGTDYYTLTAGPFVFPASPISFNNFYGTQAAATILPSLASLPNLFARARTLAIARVTYQTNGNWTATQFGYPSINGAWYTPTTVGIGSNYWIRYTRTYFSEAGPVSVVEFGIPYTWTSMSSEINAGMQVRAIDNPPNGSAESHWTVQIATDAAGTNIVATKTNWIWQVSVF